MSRYDSSVDLTLQDWSDFNDRNKPNCIQVVAVRKDHKKRKWCPRTDFAGMIRTGYHPESYSDQESGHFVYRADMKIQGHGRGQSAYYMYLELPHGQTIQFGATGVDMLMKMFANGHVNLKGNGYFEIAFVVEKKGANVYAEPVYVNPNDHILIEDFANA